MQHMTLQRTIGMQKVWRGPEHKKSDAICDGPSIAQIDLKLACRMNGQPEYKAYLQRTYSAWISPL